MGDPAYAHIAVVNASDLSVAGDPYRAVLRMAVLHMEVRIAGGAVSVTWNGNTVLSDVVPPWPLPAVGYPGFTASTGVSTDEHHVLSLTISCLPPE